MARHDLGDGIVLYTSDEWRRGGCQPRAMEPRDFRRDVYEFIVHHSGGATLGDPDPFQWARNIWTHHVKARGYSDIAYHALVDDDGRILEGRDGDFRGGHTGGRLDPGVDHNRRGFGVCLLRTGAGLTDRAKLALRKLYGLTCLVAERQLIPACHRDFDRTTCPGDDLAAFVRAGMLLPAPATPGPVVPPGPDPHAQPLPWPGTYLRRGDSGELVRQWQFLLTARGYALTLGPADGIFGRRTERATKQFQKDRGLEPDGIVGPKTWAAAFS